MTVNPSTALMRRMTVQDIVAKRNHALNLYSEAYEKLTAAVQAVGDAVDADVALSTSENRYNYHLKEDKTHFHYKIELPPRDQYMATARHIVDTDAWAHIIKLTDLELLMDKTAKDAFHQQLLKEPPEFTVENVCATLETTIGDASTIFKRGIAKCFSELDRRFKSHDGWKIGSRVILSGAFDGMGWWSYYRNHKDTIMDVERVFAVLDGEKPKYCTINAAIDEARTKDGFSCCARQTEVESEYFLVRIYKNGNCHIWFKRDDLVARVNKLLAEYYGAVIPEEREAEEDPLASKKTALARHFGFYPTPNAAAANFLHDIPIWQMRDKPKMRVLEPSAGTGNLARRLVRPDMSSFSRSYRDECHRTNIVDCVEVQPALADALRAEGLYNKVYRGDFLALKPATTGLYDMVVMNPPFDRERDIDHVMHALEFLKPGATLAAIMSAGTEFRETKKSIAFRALMEKWGARWNDMPAGSFSEVGTNVNTVRLIVKKPNQ